jgi:signal peptidase II
VTGESPVEAPAAATEPPAAATAGLPSEGVNKVLLMLSVAGIVVVLDYLTKQWVVSSLTLHYPQPVIGDILRLTYTHNPGAAFGINIGEHSRLFFLGLSLVALTALGWMYAATPRADLLRLAALALVCGGAIGNILDRLRYDAGVVDFIDVGLGGHRFWIFNVADSAVSVGAVLLLISFYLEERREPGDADA